MSTSYQTLELIASHHAELERLCAELLETGSRLPPEDPRAEAFRQRVRALGWRLRAHRAEEAAALLAEAGPDRQELASRMRTDVSRRVETLFARADREEEPLALASAACTTARECRAELDRLVRAL